MILRLILCEFTLNIPLIVIFLLSTNHFYQPNLRFLQLDKRHRGLYMFSSILITNMKGKNRYL